MTTTTRRPMRKELIDTLRFIAFAEQAYRGSHGPEFVLREATKAAWEALQRENSALMAKSEGRA